MSLGEGNEGSGEKKKTVKVSQIKTRINKLPIFFLMLCLWLLVAFIDGYQRRALADSMRHLYGAQLTFSTAIVSTEYFLRKSFPKIITCTR